MALSQNTLQELANEMGIQQRVATMNEAQKAQLRYIQIIKSTTEWQGDMARTLISPANALRVLQQQFVLLGRAIGRVFLPIIMKLLPYVMALTQMLTDLANKISAWTGYKITDIDYSTLQDMSTYVEDIGDEADSTTKKLQTMLAPFDELNVVQKQNEGTGTGLSGLGGDLGLDLPEYDALAGLTDHLSKQVENAKKNLNDILDIIKLIGTAFASWKIANSIMDFLDKWGLIDKKSLTKTIGLTLIVGGITLTALGELDIEKDFWKGVLEKIAGTSMLAGGTYMLTKKVSLTLLITGISLFIQGTIDKKKFDNDSMSILEQQLGVAGAAGGTYMFTKSITITLLVTLGLELISIGNSVQEIIDQNPTFSELMYGIGQTMLDFILMPFLGLPGVIFGEQIRNFFVEKFNMVKDKIFEWGGNVIDWFKELPGKIGNSTASIPSVIGNKFGEAKDKVFEISGNIVNELLSIPGKLISGLSNIPNIFGDVFGRARDKVKEIWGNITNLFGKGGNVFNGIVDGISDVFKRIANGAIDGINTVIASPVKGINSVLNTIRDIDLPLIGKPFKGFWGKNPISIPKIPRFAEGGFPQTGEFFLARESGAELVGRIGNKTAVANNDQITTAMTNAMLAALNSANTNNKQPIQNTIYIGNRKVFEGMNDYVDSENDRYGTNYVRV